MTVEKLQLRVLQARGKGWHFEDSRLTPGIPVLGCVGPDGKRQLLPRLGNARYTIAEMMQEMDEAGVPPL